MPRRSPGSAEAGPDDSCRKVRVGRGSVADPKPITPPEQATRLAAPFLLTPASSILILVRRWRWAILLLIVLPVYAWLQMGVAACICAMIVSPDNLDFDQLVVIFNPVEWLTWEPSDYLLVLLPGALLAAAQIAFILPAFNRRLRRGDRAGLPLSLAIIAAALAGAVLTVGLIYALLEFFRAWETGDTFPWGWAEAQGYDPQRIGSYIFWGQVVVSWGLWTGLLLLFFSRADPRRLHRRLLLLIFAGTLVELLITIPIEVMVRRRTNCYCNTGSYLALCCAVWATFWLCGPGAILVLTRKRRRLWGETLCLNCGYAKGPSPGPCCPECGYDWTIKNRAGADAPARQG